MSDPGKAAEAFPEAESSGDTYQQEDRKCKLLTQPTKLIRWRGEIGVPKKGRNSSEHTIWTTKRRFEFKSNDRNSRPYTGGQDMSIEEVMQRVT